ncbi:hypothetical protein KJ951_01180 [Patescibacteria group bacterium]|nr:hypothetical protein [Patescibacteria group bacterium]MBU1702993.1 hypothetical protein [Patescibacteria group bacterium]MBU1953692.1 hypothetical protein [Patescibacteria group bacterium]
MFKKSPCDYWKCANAVGLFLVALFVICFAWYFIRPVEQELHMQMMKLSFFGFEDMSVVSFILGAIQSYVWGYIVVGLWTLVGCCIKPGKGGGGCCGG